MIEVEHTLDENGRLVTTEAHGVTCSVFTHQGSVHLHMSTSKGEFIYRMGTSEAKRLANKFRFMAEDIEEASA
jgi:hypothetical protein